MKTKDLDDSLREAINDYLIKNYGTRLPANKSYVIDERNDYLYMDTENENFFYIPKGKLEFKNDVRNKEDKRDGDKGDSTKER